MSKAPATPHGVSTAHFGRYIMKWGRGADGATARRATVTSQELKQADVTCEILREWHEFYLNEARANPRNYAAEARAELMNHCLTLLDCDSEQ